MVDEQTDEVLVGNHFGSRGFGHRTATGFFNLANGRKFADKALGESMEAVDEVHNQYNYAWKEMHGDKEYIVVHKGATQAAGRMNWRTRKRTGCAIREDQMREAVDAYGVELRGGGADESPFVYRKLSDVLAAHEGTIDILHTLRPVGVAMA